MKKNKKNIIIIVCIVLFLVILGLILLLSANKTSNSTNKENIEEKDVKKEKITPLLYKVTKEGSSNVIYLFGSIHAANVKNYEFPEYFNKAYKEVDYFTCEYDSTNSTSESDLSKFLYEDGSTIKEHIDEESYNKIKDFLDKKGYNISLFEYFKVSVIFSLLENFIVEDARIDLTDGIDDFMIKKAKKDGKEILEVESEEFQTNLLLNISDRVYELSIIATIDNYDESINEMKKTIEAWKSGDEKELDVLNESITEEDLKKYSKEDIDLMIDFNKKLLYDRNDTMTMKFEEYFNDNKKTIFMVGAGHIVGDYGIAKKLQDKGYIVEKLS